MPAPRDYDSSLFAQIITHPTIAIETMGDLFT
jgi:hypothetical protein